MDAGLLFAILAVLGLLSVAGLIALVIWLARRTQRPATPTGANDTPAPPR